MGKADRLFDGSDAHNYPKLINSNEVVIHLVRGASVVEPEEADLFCSVKKAGQEFNLFISTEGLENESQ